MKERFELIREICAGRACLDLGIVGDVEHHLRDRTKWVFHHICEVADLSVGVDIDPAALARMHAAGYRGLVCADAEHFSFRRRFDVIVGGEIIEHLSNPGRFAHACREHLSPSGVLVLSTPNTFAVNNLLKGMIRGHVPLYVDHVNAYTPALLAELLRRADLETVAVHYFTERNPGIKNAIFRMLSAVRPTWSEGLLVVARAKRR